MTREELNPPLLMDTMNILNVIPARSTHLQVAENAVETARLWKAQGYGSGLLITSASHIARSRSLYAARSSRRVSCQPATAGTAVAPRITHAASARANAGTRTDVRGTGPRPARSAASVRVREPIDLMTRMDALPNRRPHPARKGPALAATASCILFAAVAVSITIVRVGAGRGAFDEINYHLPAILSFTADLWRVHLGLLVIQHWHGGHDGGHGGAEVRQQGQLHRPPALRPVRL